MAHSEEQTNTTTYNYNSDKHYLTIVVPAYNEETRIYDNLLETTRIIETFVDNFQILIVNDGSKDNTKSEILRAIEQDTRISLIDSHPNKGKGYAIYIGTQYANADYIAFLDADLELNPRMLKSFLSELKKQEADIAIGSKMHKDSKLHYPLQRKIMSLGYYLILKMLFHLRIKDTQTGIKLFKAEIIKPICEDLHTFGFAFDIEILATATLNKHKIIEMPIELEFSRDRKMKSRFSLKTVWAIYKDTLMVHKVIKQKKHYTRLS